MTIKYKELVDFFEEEETKGGVIGALIENLDNKLQFASDVEEDNFYKAVTDDVTSALLTAYLERKETNQPEPLALDGIVSQAMTRKTLQFIFNTRATKNYKIADWLASELDLNEEQKQKLKGLMLFGLDCITICEELKLLGLLDEADYDFLNYDRHIKSEVVKTLNIDEENPQWKYAKFL